MHSCFPLCMHGVAIQSRLLAWHKAGQTVHRWPAQDLQRQVANQMYVACMHSMVNRTELAPAVDSILYLINACNTSTSKL